MEPKEKTPEVHTPDVSNVQSNIGINVCHHKDRYFHSPIQQKIYNLLRKGGRYSVVELCQMFNISDPRSQIRYIRNSGVPVLDEWVDTTFSRHKVYFLG